MLEGSYVWSVSRKVGGDTGNVLPGIDGSSVAMEFKIPGRCRFEEGVVGGIAGPSRFKFPDGHKVVPNDVRIYFRTKFSYFATDIVANIDAADATAIGDMDLPVDGIVVHSLHGVPVIDLVRVQSP